MHPKLALLQPSQAGGWNHDKCMQLLLASAPLEGSEDRYNNTRSFVLDDATITKLIDLAEDPSPETQREVLAMRFVYEHTTIPVPRVYKIWEAPEVGSYIRFFAMDYIRGQRLDYTWPNLSIWESFVSPGLSKATLGNSAIFQDPRSSIPGPLGPTPRRCPDQLVSWQGPEGPFLDSVALNTFINERVWREAGAEIPARFRIPEPLFFTHQDINMRNVILDQNNLVWLIDWDWSGFYPRYFEFTSMKMAAEYVYTRPTPLSWRRCVPFIADPYLTATDGCSVTAKDLI